MQKLSVEDQQRYQSNIRMLLFLVKHSRPDIATAIRELSKANDNAKPAAFCELLQVIRYVLDTKNLGFKLEPTGNASKPWKIICSSHSDSEKDPVSRRSISGFILYVLGVLVS